MRRTAAVVTAAPRLLVVVSASLVLSTAVLLVPSAPAATGVPSPESVLGFVPGEDRKLADWSQVLAYLKALDEASDRVSVEDVGKTTQGRPFVIVTVTSAANHARLEEIRDDNARLADPRGLGEAEAERLIRDGKVVVAMAYSIHSTEVGGTLASLRLLHHLASSDDEAVRAVLDRRCCSCCRRTTPTGPISWPSGTARQLGTPFEGTAPPVLYHPYTGHDNNRDWYMFTQAETRLTLTHLYHRWHPQIVHDVHQMGPRGARLFVPPYADPWEPNVDGALVAAAGALGSHVASRLTTEGHTGVVTGALFDALDAGPRVPPHARRRPPPLRDGVRAPRDTGRGEGGGARAARLRLRPAHRLRQLPRALAGRRAGGSATSWSTQLAASLALLEHAARNREHWLRTSLAVNRRACTRRTPFAFVVPPAQRDPSAVARLVEVLRLGEVEVQRARAPFEAAGGPSRPGLSSSRCSSRRAPSRRRSWSVSTIPTCASPRAAPRAAVRRHRPHPAPAPGRRGRTPSPRLSPPTSSPVEAPGVPPGRVDGKAARLALGHGTGELVALGRLLEQGVTVRWALEPFADAAGPSPPGRSSSPAPPDASSSRSRASSASRRGPSAPIRAPCASARPRVGLYQSWVASMDEGWTRFVFEKEMGVAYQELHDLDVRAGHLRERFDAIVLPDQAPASLLNGHAPGSLPEEYAGGLGARGERRFAASSRPAERSWRSTRPPLFAIDQLQLPVRNAVAGLEPTAFFARERSWPRGRSRPSPWPTASPETTPVWFEVGPRSRRRGLGRPALRGRGPAPLRLAPRGRSPAGEGGPGGDPLGTGRVVLYGFRPQYRGQSRVTYAALLNALYLSAAEP